MRDVVVVPLDALGERSLPAQAVDLRPAGDPRLDAVAVVVADDVLVEQLDELRALGAGPDQAHLAAQDVQQLRQLVDRGATQEAPDRRAAVATLDSARRGIAAEQRVERMGVVLAQLGAASGSMRIERNL